MPSSRVVRTAAICFAALSVGRGCAAHAQGDPRRIAGPRRVAGSVAAGGIDRYDVAVRANELFHLTVAEDVGGISLSVERGGAVLARRSNGGDPRNGPLSITLVSTTPAVWSILIRTADQRVRPSI